MDVNTRNRADLKAFFVKNSIPTQSNFADLIDGMLNQKDDGFVKAKNLPLSIEAADPGVADSEKKAVTIYQSFADPNPAWTLSLNPRTTPSDPKTAKLGFAISDGEGTNRLFIDRNSGHIGIGITAPTKRLHIEGGELRIRATHNNPTSDIGVFYAQNLTQGIGIGSNRIEAIGSNTDQDILIIPKGTGNVGIGTTSLEARLTVSSLSSHLQLRRETPQTTGGKQLFLELFQADTAPAHVPEVAPSIRFHHSSRFWHRIEARLDGFHFKTGDMNLDDYVDLRAGKIISPKWKVTRLFDRKAGPLPVEASFTSNGGTLVMFTSGTAWKTTAGSMSLQFTIDGGSDRYVDCFTNEAASHKAFPTTVEVFSGISAGPHTFRIAIFNATAIADGNDRFYATLLELPF